jgi:hypothetical protein
MSEVTPEEIGAVLTGLVARADAELYAKQEAELEENWFFKWDEARSVEWNTYLFSDLLEMYKRTCRRWEEKHNGSCCVVERVRDKYVMPKVREFLAELARHNAQISGGTPSAESNCSTGGI